MARKVRGGWGVALGIWVFYTAGMALIMAMTTQAYADAHLLMDEVWWQVAILAVLTVLIARWTHLRMQRSLRITWFSLLLIIPVLVTIGGFVYSASIGGNDWRLVAVATLGTLFVGIGEETAFRGVALNAVGERTTVFWAVVVSSVLFGTMHLSNLFSSPAGSVVPQVVITSLVGLLFGWVYVSTRGNLILLIVLHWLYDAALVAGLATGFGVNWLGSLPALAIGLIAIISTVVMGLRYRGRRLAEVMAG